jgi:hypothetical protein
MVSMAVAGLAKVSESGICLQKFPDFPAFIRVHQSDRQPDCVAVLQGYAYAAFIFCYSGDLVYAEVFFEEFGIPSDCEDTLVSCQSVDEGSEVECKQEYGGQDENDDQYPEYGAFRAVDEKLESHGEEQQSAQEAEQELLCLISDDELVHRML